MVGRDPDEPLTTGEDIERIALGLELRVADRVVEPDTRALGHDLAPEDVAERLRHAYHVTLPVGHHEVRGVPELLGEIQHHSRGARGRACRRIFYRGGLLLPVVLGEQQVQGRPRDLRVGGVLEPLVVSSPRHGRVRVEVRYGVL
jgi:hypothetical protein